MEPYMDGFVTGLSIVDRIVEKVELPCDEAGENVVDVLVEALDIRPCPLAEEDLRGLCILAGVREKDRFMPVVSRGGKGRGSVFMTSGLNPVG